MAATPLLGLTLPTTGTLSGTWGDTVNNEITSLLDTAVAGTTTISTDVDVTLTSTAGAANQARSAILLFTGARTLLRTVTAPAQSKVYVVQNLTTGGFSVKLVAPGPTTGVTILNGEEAVIAWNGSDFVRISTMGGPINGTTGTFTGAVSGTTGTFSGNLQVPSLNGGQLAGLRNKLTNGTFLLDQRNSGAAQTIVNAAALVYTVDRFYAYCTGANVTGQRIAGTSPNAYLYRFTSASASVTKIAFAQRIENVNCQDLAGNTATLSVDLSNSLLTTVTWNAWYANTANTFGTLASPTRTSIATGTFTVTSTLTRYSTNISIPAGATTGIEVELSVGSQTSGTWSIGSVQLELGSVATPFEQRPLALETQLCGSPDNTTQLGVSPGTSVVATSVNGGQLAGLRNRLINGGTNIQQRGQIVPTATAAYGPDRWQVAVSGGTSISATSNIASLADCPSRFGSYITGTWITGQPYWIQKIESRNVKDLVNQPVTVSGYINQPSGVNDTYTVRLICANTVDTFSATTVIATNTTATITGGSTVFFSTTFSATTMNVANIANGIAVEIFKTTASTQGTTGNYVLSSTQLELGSVATPFEQRSIGIETVLAYRYYYKVFPGIVNGTFAFGAVNSTTNAIGIMPFPTQMRIAPALEQTGTANQYQVNQFTSAVTCSSVPVISQSQVNLGSLLFTVASGLVVGNSAILRSDATNGATAYIAWNAEL